jgi:hypothetical protein
MKILTNKEFDRLMTKAKEEAVEEAMLRRNQAEEYSEFRKSMFRDMQNLRENLSSRLRRIEEDIYPPDKQVPDNCCTDKY